MTVRTTFFSYLYIYIHTCDIFCCNFTSSLIFSMTVMFVRFFVTALAFFFPSSSSLFALLDRYFYCTSIAVLDLSQEEVNEIEDDRYIFRAILWLIATSTYISSNTTCKWKTIYQSCDTTTIKWTGPSQPPPPLVSGIQTLIGPGRWAVHELCTGECARL